MTTLDGRTPDIAAENIEQLKKIFPDVFEEGKVDFDKLKQDLGEYVDDEKERYNFTWNGKGRALRLSQTPSTGTLRPCEAESKNWDDTQNLYIEGDNLEVLKLLQKSYHGKIKMIYIDPPYNTGNDFVYPDDFSDSIDNYKKITGQADDEGRWLSTNRDSNGKYHTDWLNMMYPRLRLARNLLTDDGVIFLSIDDNEIDNLKKICNEVLGEDNFIDCITWNTRIPKNDNKGLGNIHQYILVYVKTGENNRQFSMPKDGLDDVFEFLGKLKRQGTPIPEAEEELKKFYAKKGYDRGITLYNALDEDYQPWGKINMSWPNSDTFGPTYDVLHPLTKKPTKKPDRGWRWNQETMNSHLNNNCIERYDGSVICGDIWFAKDENTQPSSIKYLRDVGTMLLRTIISLKSDGGVNLEEIFTGKSFFSNPKPTALLRLLLNSIAENEGIFLDFFSGSATTAHAVMQLNAEDGGNRRFIMVQLPEPCAEDTEAAKAGYQNICEIGKERIRRAGEKIKAEVEEQNAQMKIDEEPKPVPDIGFKVFKLDSSNLRKWQPDYDNLEQSLDDIVKNYVDGRSELDVVYEIMLKMGLDLTWPLDRHSIGGKNVYVIGMGALMICLDDDITTDVADGMAALYKDLAPETWKVVFKDNGFATDSAKVNVREILKCAGLDEDAFTTV